MRYRLSDLSEEDLRETWQYVALESGADAADHLIDAIFERFELLATNLGWGEAVLSLGTASGRRQPRAT